MWFMHIYVIYSNTLNKSNINKNRRINISFEDMLYNF